MRGLTRWLFLTCVALGVAYVVLFLGLAAVRATYPFEIEWMEGGMLSHAARLLDGQPIYAKPSSDFVPFFYTPGYPAAVAGLAQFTDLTLPLGRIVSIISTLLCFGFAFRVGQREADWRYGLLAMGIYAALFRTNGTFYDLARPDALFMALLCGAVYVAYYKRSWQGAMLAGAIFAAGFLTKQTVSVFVPVTALYLLWRNWRHAALFSVVAFGLSAIGIAAINHATEGWFWTYVFEGHQGHLFYWKNILVEYWRDVLFLAPLLLLLPLLWFGYKVPIPVLSVLLAAHWTYAYIFRARTLDYVPHMYYRELWYEDPRWAILIPPALIAGLLLAYRAKNPPGKASFKPQTHAFWLLMFVAGTGASGLNHSTQWAYSNCFMLLSMFAAVLIALACRDLFQSGARWTALIPAAILVQLVAWAYNPLDQIPKSADHEAYAQFDAVLSTVDGPVFVPAHPLYAWQRNGQVHVHQMGLQDVAFMGGVKDFNKRVREHYWAGIVVDEQNRVPGIVGRYYVGHRFTYADKDALRTKTGFLVRPETLWLAQDPVPRALAEGISANFEEPKWVGWRAEGTAFASPSVRSVNGRQGKRAVVSTKAGQGTLRSSPIVLQGRALSMLLGGSGGPGRVVRIMRGDQELARKNVPNQRRTAFQRVSILLDDVGDQPVEIEIVDHDPKGSVAVDDFRVVPRIKPSSAEVP